MSNSLTCLLVSFLKIDALLGNEFLQWRGNAVKPTAARELEREKKGALQAMKVLTKAQYDDLGGNVWKMGALVAALNRIVLEYLPCPHKRTQLCALFSILVPFGRG